MGISRLHVCGCALKIIDAETDLDLLANSASTIVTHVVEDTTKSIICHIAPTTGLQGAGAQTKLSHLTYVQLLSI